MRSVLLCALILTGCVARPQPNSVEAISEAKRQSILQQNREKEKYNQTVRLAARQVYLQDHPGLSSDIRKAILDERIKKGMDAWQVIAAYSLWDYADHPSAAKYRGIGAMPLWTWTDRRITTNGPVQMDEWTLQKQKETQHLFFEDGILKRLKD